MNKQLNKKGFTLTEILIVLVIAGILLALILPNSLRAIQRGNTVSGDSNVQSCNTAVMLCYADNNRSWANCDTVGELTSATPPYLKSAPLNASGVAVTVVQDTVTGGYICQ